MLAESVASAGLADVLDAVLSVEAAGVFKPDMRVYRLATDHFGIAPADEYGLRRRASEVRDLAGLPALRA
jgi:hypothetical protein